MRVPKKIILFVSGGGSNAKAIFNYFKSFNEVEFSLLICNNPKSAALTWADEVGIPTKLVTKSTFQDVALLEELKAIQPDLLLLAGFLWMIPKPWLEVWPEEIINIHPALLPDFGGKGMYGMNVHKAVKAAQMNVSGMTIHRVNEHYDEGAILLQARCSIASTDTAEEIAQKVLKLEHFYYPRLVSQLLGVES